MDVPESNKSENQLTFAGFIVVVLFWLFFFSADCAAIWFMK